MDHLLVEGDKKKEKYWINKENKYRKTPNSPIDLEKIKPIDPTINIYFKKYIKKEKKTTSIPLPLGTPHISSRSTIVKIVPPHIINPSLYVVTVWMISQNFEI